MFFFMLGLYAIILGVLQICLTYKEIKKTREEDDDNTLFVRIAHWSSVSIGRIMTLMGVLVII